MFKDSVLKITNKREWRQQQEKCNIEGELLFFYFKVKISGKKLEWNGKKKFKNETTTYNNIADLLSRLEPSMPLLVTIPCGFIFFSVLTKSF